MALMDAGGLDQGAEERVDPHPVGQVLAVSVALVGDPRKVRSRDALRFRARGQAEPGEVEAIGRASPAEVAPWTERSDQPEILELLDPILAPSQGAEEQDPDLVGGEDLMVEEGQEDSVVSLIERQGLLETLGFASSTHTVSTVLPSFGGWSRAKRPRDLRFLRFVSSAVAPPMRRGDHATASIGEI